MLLVLSYLSASAQVATPLLDRTMKVQSSAAAGWRDKSTVGLQAFSATGKVKADSFELGEVEIGGSIPAVLAAFKGEAIGLELFVSTDTTKKVDLNIPIATGIPNQAVKTEQKLPENRLNLAYVFGEALSVGLGYRLNETKEEQTISGSLILPVLGAIPLSSPVTSVDGKETETGLMVSASLKLADIFYVAGGMENVDIKKSSDIGSDSVDNAWTNTIVGLGLLVGDPGESRFRVEYAIIQSPESVKAAETGKTAHSHYKTDYNTMSLEAQFGDVLLSYISETSKYDIADSGLDLDALDDEEKVQITLFGAGWMPEEGLIVSAYMWNAKTTKSLTDGTEITFEPKGYRVNLGWNF
ncbi:MAG: hypothetical protein HN354_08725 [Deltaproteobacteria bacterium]|nr:hypothetical protein [Deltaproteobacteria bacterium]